jgi:hypothetical protein
MRRRVGLSVLGLLVLTACTAQPGPAPGPTSPQSTAASTTVDGGANATPGPAASSTTPPPPTAVAGPGYSSPVPAAPSTGPVPGVAPQSTAPQPGAPNAAPPAAPPSPAAPPKAPGPAAPAVPVGPEVALRAATLPAGPAAGTVTVAYSGLGAITSPASGTCAHDTKTDTTLALTAGTATLTVILTPGNANLHFVDVGVEQRNDLAAGTYLVDGAHLHVDTALTETGPSTTAGNLTLDVTC